MKGDIMMQYQNTDTDKVRKAMQKITKFPFGVADIGIELGSSNRIYGIIRDMKLSGEIKSSKYGQYTYIGEQGITTKQQRAWKVLRAKRNITIGELEELADIPENYAVKWLQMLIDNDIVKKQKKKYRLINDTVTMPVDEKNAERMKKYNKLRAKAREAGKLLNEINQELETI
jgi:hypothetical protein